jgi:hypothetical protein
MLYHRANASEGFSDHHGQPTNQSGNLDTAHAALPLPALLRSGAVIFELALLTLPLSSRIESLFPSTFEALCRAMSTDSVPPTLYRVQHDRSFTQYDPEDGFMPKVSTI